MTTELIVRGATAPSGVRYVCIIQGNAKAWIPEARFHVGAEPPYGSISEQGIRLFDKSETNALTQQIKALSDFPATNIVEKVGWNGDTYALPDGSVFAPTSGETVVAFLTPNIGYATRGSLKMWRRQVAAPLGGQTLGALALMMMFVSPLLRFLPEVRNFAIELVAKQGGGKTTLQALASSAIGNPTLGAGPTYWMPLDTTLNAVEDIMAEHADLPLIFDDSNNLDAGQGQKALGQLYQSLAFKLWGGEPKARKGATARQNYRTTTLISANQSIRELAGGSSKRTLAAVDRLLTISVPNEWNYGVYESLPKGFGTGADYARSMMSAAGANHGMAYRRFIRKLVDELGRGEADLNRRIEGYQQRFLRKADCNRNSGSELRVAEAFATIYAAGKLAQRYGALPKLPFGLAAISRCYRLHQLERLAHKPFDERLRLLLSRSDVLQIETKSANLESSRLRSSIGTVWPTKRGPELRMTDANARRAFADWDQIYSTAEVSGHLRTEGQLSHRHRQPKASLAPGMKKERLWCFRLPENWLQKS